jgi:hypothetical protein
VPSLTNTDSDSPSASSVTSTKKPSRREPAPEGYQDVVDKYFELFTAARGVPPEFDGSPAAAMQRFVRKFGRDKAIDKLERVFAPGAFYRDKATINDIASNPDRYTSPPTTGPKSTVMRQQAWTRPDGDAEEVCR